MSLISQVPTTSQFHLPLDDLRLARLRRSFIKYEARILPVLAQTSLEKHKCAAALRCLSCILALSGGTAAGWKPSALASEFLHQHRLEVHIISANILLQFEIQICV